MRQKMLARRAAIRDVGSRILAAALGGYAATYALTGALGLLLPLPPADAVYLTAMLAFAFYVVFVLWAFAARSARSAWALPLAVGGLSALPLFLHAMNR